MAERARVAITDWLYERTAAVYDAATEIDFLPAPTEPAALLDFVRREGLTQAVVDSGALDPALYAALGQGGHLARFGVGVDAVDFAAAIAAGVRVTNTPGVLAESVAEHALHLLLCLSRGLPYAGGRDAAYSWKSPGLATELHGQTLAVIGCGNIGRLFARAAAFGLGMRVIGCDPSDHDAEQMRRDYGFSELTTDFATAVRAAKVVSLHMPLLPATENFIDAERLAQMRDDAWLINTSRGPLVDEAALYDALATGGLAAAALDVFQVEPYEPVEAAKDLRTLPNVLMTGHCASSTDGAFRRMAEATIANVRAHLADDPAAMSLVRPR